MAQEHPQTSPQQQEPQPQKQAQTQEQPTGWFVPRMGPMEAPDPAQIMGEVNVRPMEPMKPSIDLGEAVARSMAPSADMTPHFEAPLFDSGDQQQAGAPMFRRGPAQGFSGMVCPLGTIGNCIYCSSLPCVALKAKVLEVCAMEYKLLANQPPLKPSR